MADNMIPERENNPTLGFIEEREEDDLIVQSDNEELYLPAEGTESDAWISTLEEK